MSSNRRPGWDVALVRWGASVVGTPFVWGSTDCGTMCRRVFEALYGPDIAHSLLGPEWSSVATAKRAFDAMPSIPEVLAALGAAVVDRTLLQTGDVIELPGEDDHGLPRLAVVTGGRLLTSSISAGIKAIPLGELPDTSVAWRLP